MLGTTSGRPLGAGAEYAMEPHAVIIFSPGRKLLLRPKSVTCQRV
jgi:hypothetical protein